MPKKTSAALPTISSDFAIIEFKKGRRALEKLVASGETIQFTISGYLQPGAQSIGNDDGISTPFWATVQHIDINRPNAAEEKVLRRAGILK